MARTEETASRGAPAPVIRRLVVAEEDGRTRLMKRQVPAWVISGLIHVVLIAAFIIFDKMTHTDTVAKEETKKPESRLAEDKKEKEADLTIPDENLDSTLVPAVEVERVTEFNVQSAVVETEAIGLPNENNTPSNLTSVVGDVSSLVGAPGAEPTTDGMAMQGALGGGGQLAMPGLNGRSGATKVALLKQGGGNDKTEAAVGRALIWLAEQQNKSGGFWEFDGSHKSDKIAATGMALLPFLAAGETHKTGTRYKSTVGGGLNYLKSQIKPNGQFAGAGMYSHAIATVAVCEAAGMTRDETYKKVARLAVDFIIKAQDGDGSWGYSANSPGDTSIVGWQLQALKSAKLADIPVNVKVLDKAIEFLESTSGDSGATYGYRAKGASHTLSAVGLLCRQYISGWTNRNPFLGRGVDFLWTKFPPREDAFDMYYYYYATQVMHFYEGQVWHRDWNPKMQKILLDKQIYTQPGTKKSDIGSWPKDSSHIGSACGKLGTTALCCLTLEVYYRHLPLYKRDAAGGIAVLEK
ncbi:MAG: terpene cyclase/mutase family protein [Planctomycetes bacterium]|nr:terpene cyclase/mutase family protein [Planctomycetota bacterium]